MPPRVPPAANGGNTGKAAPTPMWGAAFLVAVAGFLVAPGPGDALAADAKPEFSARVAPAPARAGEHVVLEISANIPPGYHLYAMTKVPGGPKPLAVTVDDSRLVSVGAWFAPAPAVAFDDRFGKAVEQFSGSVSHRRAFAVAPGAPPGAGSVAIGLTGQICDEKQCIVFRETLPLPLIVEAGAGRQTWLAVPTLTGTAFLADRPLPELSAASPQKTNAPSDADRGPPLGKGLWSFLLLAFLAGLGALATPCVFPMIPITVSYFSKYSKISVRQSAAMAAIYAISIIFCFTIIGVAVSVLFGAVGMQSLSSSAAFNIFLFILLVGFSFNLFGLFEINMPSGLIARTSAKERELTSGDARSFPSQAVGVFLMAVTFTLVSFTCTVGFVGVVLAQAAKGHWFFPALGMLAFSTSFSIPFFCLAMFPSWANKLRGKSGDWMVAIKVILGFFELAGAFKFLSNVDLLWHWGLVTRPLVLALWSAIFLTAALYLLRVFNLPSIDAKTKNVGPIRMVIAMVMFAFAIYSASGIRDTKSMGGWLDGWLPPAVYPGDEVSSVAAGGASGHPFNWIKDDLARASAAGRSANRAVFVDFTGYTCTNCRYMEASVFPRPEVADRLNQMVLAQAFTDCDEPVCEQQRSFQVKNFDTAALPFYVIMNPHDGAVLATFASSTNDAKEFAAFLQRGLDAFAKVSRPDAPPAAGSAALPAAAPPAAPPTPAAVTQISVVKGAPAVDFSFPGLADGKPWRLSQLRGKWTLVNFWASWCGPCLKELKDDFPVALEKTPWVNLVTVAFEAQDTRPAALAFVKENRLLSRSVALFGPETVSEAKLDARFSPDDSLPATYLVAPDGQVAWTHHGSLDGNVLKQVLAQTQP